MRGSKLVTGGEFGVHVVCCWDDLSVAGHVRAGPDYSNDSWDSESTSLHIKVLKEIEKDGGLCLGSGSIAGHVGSVKGEPGVERAFS
jgi:hypothetical protein